MRMRICAIFGEIRADLAYSRENRANANANAQEDGNVNANLVFFLRIWAKLGDTRITSHVF